MESIRKRRTVEIYFVLYLAALLFLLPSPKDHKGNSDFQSKDSSIIKQPFSLIPIKTTLNCRLMLDSNSVRILSLDSVNTIFYTGDVEDVKFEFVVEDQSRRLVQPINMDLGARSKNFWVEEHKDWQAVSFYWSPPLFEKENKTYLVTVYATATPKADFGTITGNKSSETAQPVKIKTQFSLNVFYLNSQPGGTSIPFETNLAGIRIDSSRFFNPFINPYSQANLEGKFSLRPDLDDIKAIAYQNWTNEIHASNINLLQDLAYQPELTIALSTQNNGGTAVITSRQSDRIIISGKTPSFGRMKVNLKIKRKYDDQEYSVSFNVLPQPIEQPTVENYLYPEQTYYFDPKLPLLGKEVKAVIKDGNTIRAESQGQRFQFTPDVSDTGKNLTFERYIDGNLLGDKKTIRVLSFQSPEIIDFIYREKGKVEVIIHSYGSYGNDNNEIKDFYIEGNAKYQDLRGKLRDLTNPSKIRIQHFLFTPVRPNDVFQFRIIAIDRRGKKSQSKQYSEN
jgi:hypothetical protein